MKYQESVLNFVFLAGLIPKLGAGSGMFIGNVYIPNANFLTPFGKEIGEQQPFF